ncbi:MAG TPA: GNAT family N-acetyltransferase [Myxococcota bacterium]|nr:GNAT family N-acetyltransferase [Myxococcota bacterium]
MDLHAELVAFLRASEIDLPDDFDDDTPLLSSGQLDSLTLFNLVLWIEEKSGREIDPTQVDVVGSWDSVRRILAFLQGAPAEQAPARPPRRIDRGERVVPYSPAYKDAIAELQTGLWSPQLERNRRYLEWKHEHNPYGGAPRIYLLLRGEELIGMRGFYPSRWQVGDPSRVVDLLVADDFMFKEEHRNEGLVTSLMQAALDDLRREGIEYVFNLSGGRITVLHSLAMGWRSAGSLAPVERIASDQGLLKSLHARAASLPLLGRFARLSTPAELSPLARFDSRLGERVSAHGERVELSATPRPKAMADLIGGLASDDRICHVRDESFFEWRFRNPLHEYRFLYVGGSSLEGYLVLKWNCAARTPTSRVQIVDLEAATPSALLVLLDAAIEEGRFPELATWQATRPRAVAGALGRFGFEATGGGGIAHDRPCILVRCLEEGRPVQEWTLHGLPLLELSRWDMRMLFTMAG